ncbi:peptide chain release factor N(5)-glutamine methyltransferase [Mucilaginibacter boryungensis]|uniref:Release factor glutamine methyltransferase n=1 Tax=Mucilaginibacter boryungensis TaxID=768480 RepID=A0ABR9XH40_9SPHI|nr:peptide chain release factor N(5)-glutamine methyltransferase [Mucilaginibacter boryungensis]MBE9666551.1 peptide chain release factor N(5)-glutamine methyltransferase [Mucilaginibacter boryungensis]
MKTVKDVFEQFKIGLADVYDPQESEAIILLILSDLLNTSKAKLKAFPETEIGFPQAEKLTSILQELKTGKPVQYILGHTEFYGLNFKVSPAVLIPRPETEELVQWIIETVKQSESPVINILDIGTGSGCIPISLKHNLLNINAFGIDISTDALEIAKQNAESNKANVNFIEADILNFPGDIALPKFDIIVSNPPYVTLEDKNKMHTNVTDFEPHTALFVPEDDPLIFYKVIADFAKTNLSSNGLIFFEINESFGTETIELLRERSFRNIELRQDMSGRDRMIKAQI